MDSGSSAPQILLAEDDEEFGSVLERWLLNRGYGCVWVRDAAGAIAELERRSFDLLLSDIDMPGNKRLALVRHVEARGDGLPVILLTGKPTFESAVDAVGSPVVAYLVKPPEAEDLFRRIAHGLAEGAARRAKAAHQRRVRESLVALESVEQRLHAGEPVGDLGIELARLLRGLIAGSAAAGPEKPLEETERVGRLEEALRDVIAVLEDTRKSFKSKQLGDLRKRLEQLPGLTM